jgi:hypothetical protein
VAKSQWKACRLRDTRSEEANKYFSTDMVFERYLANVNTFTVAVGAEEPLAEHMMVADFFRMYTSLLCTW